MVWALFSIRETTFQWEVFQCNKKGGKFVIIAALLGVRINSGGRESSSSVVWAQCLAADGVAWLSWEVSDGVELPKGLMYPLET